MQLAPGVLAHGQLDMPAGVRAAGPAAQGDVSAGQAQVVGVEVGRRQSLYLRPGRRDAGAGEGPGGGPVFGADYGMSPFRLSRARRAGYPRVGLILPPNLDSR